MVAVRLSLFAFRQIARGAFWRRAKSVVYVDRAAELTTLFAIRLIALRSSGEKRIAKSERRFQRRANSVVLLLPQRVHRLQHGSLASGINTRDNAGDSQGPNGQRGRHVRHGGRIEARYFTNSAHHEHEQARARHPDAAAHQRKKGAFQEKLQQNAAIGGAQGLAQTDLARALADRNQHDVDDADGAEGQRNQPDAAEEHVHGIENFAHGFGVLDGVPILEGVFVVPVETMVAADDLAYFFACQRMLLANPRPIINEGDRVFLTILGQGKVFPHGTEGHEDAVVGGVVVAVADSLDHADHFKANSVEQDGRANRLPAGVEVLQHLVAQHGDQPLLRFVVLIEPATIGQRQITDDVVVRWDSADFAVGVVVGADLANIQPRQHRRGRANVRRFLQDVLIILVGEVVVPGRTHIAGDGGSASGKDEHDVFAQRVQLAAIAGAKALAQSHQQQQRSHAPGDAEHREERTQLVRPQRAQHLAENLKKHHEELNSCTTVLKAKSPRKHGAHGERKEKQTKTNSVFSVLPW